MTIDRAAQILGFGTAALGPVTVDDSPHATGGPARRARRRRRAEIILRRGPATSTPATSIRWAEIVDGAHGAGAWVHIDGAFGLWAAAAREHRPCSTGVPAPTRGRPTATSGSTCPHDCGLAFVADPEPHRNAIVVSAAYLRGTREGERDGLALGAGLLAPRVAASRSTRRCARSARRAGRAVERWCACARRFAKGPRRRRGIEFLNDVVLDQVLVRFADDDATTDAVVDDVQAEGTY